jgi:hypothetical protein
MNRSVRLLLSRIAAASVAERYNLDLCMVNSFHCAKSLAPGITAEIEAQARRLDAIRNRPSRETQPRGRVQCGAKGLGSGDRGAARQSRAVRGRQG